MGFYWKDQKDQASVHVRSCALLDVDLFVQLTARRGQFSAEERQAWTTFDMKLRDPSPMPLAFDFARFLSSSITFMSHLSEISVFFGEDRLMKVSKTKDFPESLRLPAGLTRVGPKGLMHVVGMNRTRMSSAHESRLMKRANLVATSVAYQSRSDALGVFRS